MQTLKRVLPVLTAIALMTGALMTAPMAQAAAADKKTAASKKTADKKTASDTKTSDAKLVDINTGSAADLDALPGIGKVRGAAIIKGRPYKNKTQLVSKGILTQAVYDKISDRIIAKQ